MSMTDWKVTNYVDPTYGNSWVYKENSAFPGLHMSFSLKDPTRTHVANNDRTAYYFGVSKTFNSDNLSDALKDKLRAAWKDYYTVTAKVNVETDEHLATAFDAARAHRASSLAMRALAAAPETGGAGTPLTDFESKQRDVQMSFDYNQDPDNVPPSDESKLRFVMQVVQQQGTNQLTTAGVDVSADSETWIQFFARYPLLFNFRSRSKKHMDESDFTLGVNAKLLGAIIDAKAPQDIKQAFIQALQDSSGEILRTTRKTSKLQYLALIRTYSKASTLSIYRAQLNMETSTVKTLCGGTQSAHLMVDYDQVDFEINNTLALALYDSLSKVAVEEAASFMTMFFRQFAKEEYDKFAAWLKSLGH